MSPAAARLEEYDPQEPETGEEMSAEERARLHAVLWQSRRSVQAGQFVDPPFLEESEDDGPA